MASLLAPLLLAAAPAQPISADSILPQGRMSSIVPVFTAFGTDGKANISAVADQYAYASQNGIDVLLLMGTTGEWPTLTVDERMALADAWCTAKQKHVPRSGGTTPKFMLNIGHASPYEARRMATHAVGLTGIDSLLVSPPGLPYQAPNLDLLIEALAIALEPAPKLPAFYYHYQDLYGDSFKMKDLFHAAQAGRLPTLVGAKFAGAGINLVDVMESSQIDPSRFGNFVTGDKLASLAALQPGPRGLIVLSWEGPMASKLFDSVAKGDVKGFTSTFAKMMAWRELASPYNAPGGNYQITGIKGVARLAGLPVGDCRPPLPSITAAQLAQLKANLTAADLMPAPLLPY